MTTSGDILSRQPERLVITGFRNIMAACDLGDMACWEAVWRQYIAEVGTAPACRMVGELQYWARSIRHHADRPMSYYPQCCRYLCHDECMAVSIIAAAQAQDRETGFLAARYLTGQNCPDQLAEVWHASIPFAAALCQSAQFVLPVTGEVVESINRMQQHGECRSACRRLN